MIDTILTAIKNARAYIAQSQIATAGSTFDVAAKLAELDDTIRMLQVLMAGTHDDAIKALSTTNPDADGFYTWVLRVGIHKTWVEDGADFTDDRVHAMLANTFVYAHGGELKGTVLARPRDTDVAAMMGYKTADEYRQSRDGIARRGRKS